MVMGMVMVPGVDGAVFVFTEPSSETKRAEGKMKAGRMPSAPVQPWLSALPLELQCQASVELLRLGERSHQLAADPLYLAIFSLVPLPSVK